MLGNEGAILFGAKIVRQYDLFAFDICRVINPFVVETVVVWVVHED